jgi:hypothetical protein
LRNRQRQSSPRLPSRLRRSPFHQSLRPFLQFRPRLSIPRPPCPRFPPCRSILRRLLQRRSILRPQFRPCRPCPSILRPPCPPCQSILCLQCPRFPTFPPFLLCPQSLRCPSRRYPPRPQRRSWVSRLPYLPRPQWRRRRPESSAELSVLPILPTLSSARPSRYRV